MKIKIQRTYIYISIYNKNNPSNSFDLRVPHLLAQSFIDTHPRKVHPRYYNPHNLPALLRPAQSTRVIATRTTRSIDNVFEKHHFVQQVRQEKIRPTDLCGA